MDFDQAIKRLAPIDDEGNITVFIETPKGSRQKYDVDHESGLFSWSLELPEGVEFPFSFGFVPNTLAEDGDAIDIILLLDGSVPSGTIVQARAVGILEAEQDEGEEGLVRNDRVIAIANLSRSFAGIYDLTDLRDGMAWDIEEFFKTYNRMIGREFNIVGRKGAKEAHQRVVESIEKAKNT